MFKYFLSILLILIFYKPIYAIDGQVSIEYDRTRQGFYAVDTIINIGQNMGRYRPYINFEYLKDNYNFNFVNNSATVVHTFRKDLVDTRLGTEIRLFDVFRLDIGLGLYNYNNNLNATNEPYAFTRITYQFDTEK